MSMGISLQNGTLNLQLWLKYNFYVSWWLAFFCFDSNKWIIAHDFIKQNPLHDKIISFLFPLLPIHTVLNNIISTQILQDKSFKYIWFTTLLAIQHSTICFP